jgi:hypothetical protein
MSDVPPTPPPLARRAVPKTVRVRRDDLTAEPSEEPTGPPKVLVWFRLGCVGVALAAFVVATVGAYRFASDDQKGHFLPWTMAAVGVFVAYTLPLWWRRPKWWHWVYGLALLLPGIVPLTNPMSVVLLVFWCRPRTVRFFRLPPPSYAATPPPPTDGTPVVPPPGVLFPFRLLCLFGVGGCLLGMLLAVVVHSSDRQPEWDVLWWLGGLAVAGVLFLMGLFVRGRRPWVWWFGVVLLGLCSLSGYLTLLAVPVLAFWVRKEPRAYYGMSSTVTP